ncbi:DUF4145 domain-containing protein [Pseudomonas putida]|uniref:DUF4145 domain-containing protein n=1 Tax=Pseudomonas putida TaxID=303 RepID=UPI0018AC2192|nr:DUF4145 domain-containing protein [Pseudomonas putida]MBF8667988.1 DUF4145 domain-containing protein [Pseudomonas putida]MBF8711379.1 DUF4145 domain-containing protein [Pseudomonas putida]
MTAKLQQHFTELEKQLEAIRADAANKLTSSGNPIVNGDLLLRWSVRVESLIEKVCGKDSSQLRTFVVAQKGHGVSTNLHRLNAMEGVFYGVKDDFEGGYLHSLRSLVQAEVFSSELEQAEELLKTGYETAAAVIAGVVLETALRDLCTTHGIAHGTLNRMNDDLAKAGAYNANQKKQITSLSAIRNSAAHGKPEEFTADQVRGMIDDVQRFLLAHQ